MTRAELIELIRNGENSGVEFKRDSVRAERLAAEMAGMLNLRGGHILLGVEDDGTVCGLTRSRKEAEEWVMEVARIHIQPGTIPYWEAVRWDHDTDVGIVFLPDDAPDKPYKAKRGAAWVTKVRVGTTTRDATREEEARLYQQSGRVDYGLKPVLGAGLDFLDQRRLHDYFGRVLDWGDTREELGRNIESEGWRTLLVNLDLAVRTRRTIAPTINGALLFGRNPKRRLPQSGIRAICYAGDDPDYATRTDQELRGPLVPLIDLDGLMMKRGLVDQAWDFVRLNTMPSAYLEGMRRIDRWEFPEDVIREAVTNALVHRDYSIAGTDVMLEIFSNRVEITSPGRLPNTVTPAGMRSGMRYARNQALVNVMRDYGYADARGMGVRTKIIPGMRAHNGTEPELIEDEHRFTVRLWKQPPTAPATMV